MSSLVIMTVTGIRPDFIRMSAVFKELDSRVEHVLVNTGQHYDSLMSDVFFEELDIRVPDYNLGIGRPGKEHYEQLADLSVGLLRLIKDEQMSPDLVVFLGDSNSVLASVSVRKEGFKVAHIEAGMRSYDKRMLEETNRVICDHCSDMLFVYHRDYKENCLREGIDPASVSVVGNTIVEVCNNILQQLPALSRDKGHILLDVHRPENFLYRDRLSSILSFAKSCGRRYSVPVLLSGFGRTLSAARSFGLSLDDFEIIGMLPYKRFLLTQAESIFLISDSGTAQEEAALLGVPVVVPRDYTERPQSMQHQCSVMLKVGDEASEAGAVKWLDSCPVPDPSWLGDGFTAGRIADAICCTLRRGQRNGGLHCFPDTTMLS